MAERKPAETFPVGEFIRDEIKARGLTEAGLTRLLIESGCNDRDVFACLLTAYVDDKNLILDDRTAKCLARAFGTDEAFFSNLDRAWRGQN